MLPGFGRLYDSAIASLFAFMHGFCSRVPCSYRSRKARGSKVTVEITTEADTSSRAGWPSASLRDIRDAALIEALDAASFELGSPGG